MARNGSGTYVLPAGNPVVTGSTISSTWANGTLTDIGTALTQSIAYDGQTTPVANLPMGGYAHTNIANATARTMYASAGQVQDGTASKLSSVSGTDAITATATLGLSAYVAGQAFIFVATGTNTGATTLNINSIGAKAVTKKGTTALEANDIVTGGAYEVVYDGTQFQLVNPSSNVNVSSFSAGTTGLTPSTATTGAVTLAGTLNVANGGTGATTLTANNVILGNGTSAVQTVAPGTSGNVLLSNGTTWSSGALTFTSSATANGYIKIGNITLQWGTTSPIANNSTTTVTFPVAFDNSLLNVQCEAISADNVIAYWNGVKTSKTTMTLGLDGVSASGSYAIAWFAIGY